jgi:hypothetical protein
MSIDNCPEGGEGLLVYPLKDLISLDIARCSNTECEIRHECARYEQSNIDKQYISRVVSFGAFEPINSICNFKINI